MCKIEYKGVRIELTEDQLKQIDQQRSKITSYEQIKTYSDACKVLNIEEDNTLHSSLKIKNIAKAVNSLIDNNNNFPNWKNENEVKYYPYFKLLLGGWVLCDVVVFCVVSFAEVAYFKTDSSAKYIGEQFKDLYIQVIEEKY